MPAQPTEMCENCTVARSDLRRCAGCGLVRYCSKECQRAHWKQHKPYCILNVQMVKKAEALGPEYSERLKAIGKWCDAFSPQIGAAAVSALDIMNHPELVDDFVLVIYVDFLGVSAKSPHTFDVVDAVVHPLAPLRTRALAISAGHLALFEANLASRPGMARVLLLDWRFPWSYTTPFVVPQNVRRFPRDGLWLNHLQMGVTRSGKRVRAREPVPNGDELLLEALGLKPRD
ncbi:hypothetical protein B0H19DRAFT_1160569 [Mycena capillaripes]|nr:hypothetical protein B0H19DRAFT_1160569 [Mycena capillaripes]